MYKLFLSLRYLRSHKIIYFSIAGVAVGILVMIIVTSVMGGFSRDIRTRIRGMQSDLVIVQQYPTIFFSHYEELCAKIEKIPGVKGCAPRVEWEAWIQYKGSYKTVHYVGIVPEKEKGLSNLEQFFRAGGKRHFDFMPEDYRETVQHPMIVGREFHFGGIGSRVTLSTFRPDTGQGPGIWHQKFEIVGEFKSGMAEYDSNYVFVRLEDAADFLKLTTKRDDGSVSRVVTTISITLDDYARDIEKVRAQVIETLHRHSQEYHPGRCSGMAHEHGSCGAYKTQTWEEAKSVLLQAVAVEKGIQIIILFFIVIVAGFNIIAIYTLVVRAKTRDIGIVRSLGATKGGIVTVFLLSGMACGLVGSIIGIGLGLAVAHNINEIADFIEVSSREVNQLPGAFHAGIDALATLAMAALFFFWYFFYKRERRIALELGLLTGALSGAAVWFFLGWMSPHEGCPFPEERMPHLSESTRLWASILVGAIPAFFAILREPIRRSNSDAGLSWLNLVSTVAFAGLAIAMTAVLAINNAVLALRPPERWPGLELFPQNVYYLDRIPVFIDYLTIAMIVVGTLIVSLIFSIYPALKAASYNPIEAIRDE